MKKEKAFSRRVYVLVAVMGVWGSAIGVRLGFLQVVHSAYYRNQADRQQQRTLDVTPPRGIIYDRNGDELAISVKVNSIFAVPREVDDPKETARILAKITGVPRADILERLNSDRSFVWIKRKISDTETAAIESASLPGIRFQKEDRRSYPKGEMASHVLGYVGLDEEGMGGLEYRYNASVRGVAGKVMVTTDARGKSYFPPEWVPQPGANLITTLDENIQYIVDKEVQEAAELTHAKDITAIAIDPHTGEILGMANYPTFNPNDYRRYSPISWINQAVSHTYEPGSTFKIVTATAALEEGLTSPTERIDCLMGSIVLFGHRIHDHAPFGVLTVSEIMQHSSDVGMIKLALRVGEDRFAGYIDKMGFGKPTGIDLPGEERGLTKAPSRWSKVSIGAIAMGQEIGVTPLQIVSMVSSVANGGFLYKPFVVKKIVHPTKGVLSETSPDGHRVMTPQTAKDLQGMLEEVVTDGTAKMSQLDGYRAAGKTGTAQKIDESGRYSKTKFVASFAGYAPVSDPAIAMVVVVDEPVGPHMGAQVAAPIFKKIAEQILRYKEVMPDVPQYAPRYTAKKDKREIPQARPVQAFPVVRPADFKVIDAALTVSTATPDDQFGEIIIPNFYGKSLRQVTEESLKLGLRLQSIGSGRGAAQYPPVGTHVRPGARVQVQFAAR